MLDEVVIVPVEMTNRDLLIILEVARRLGVNRNEAIRMLIRRGFESLVQEPEVIKGRGEKK